VTSLAVKDPALWHVSWWDTSDI